MVWVQEHGGTFIGGMPAIYLSDLMPGYAWTGEEEIIGNIHDGRADSEGARNGICLFIIHSISGICPSVLLPLRYVVGVSLDVVFPDYEI